MYVYFGNVQCGFVELARPAPARSSSTSETKDPKPRVLFTESWSRHATICTSTTSPRIPGTDIGSDVTESVSLQLGLTVGFEPQDEGE